MHSSKAPAIIVRTGGLDFPALEHVVLYDLPHDVVTFVHCVGRTAREPEPHLFRCISIDHETRRAAGRGASGVVSCLVQSQADVGVYNRFQSHHALLDATPLAFPSREEAEARRAGGGG